MGKSQDLYIEAKKFIPGGTQLLSKRPEMLLPEGWPAYYEKAKGCEVWDLDGKKYIDMSFMGIGTCLLGYADEDIDSAVKNAIDAASMTTLNCAEEVDLAKTLCDIHPWADMARFARTGGEAAAIAVRIARAKTGKDVVLFCGYHGWHDWYLAANLSGEESLGGHLLPGLESKGVARALEGTVIPFEYNNAEGFSKLFEKHAPNIAAVIMEPIRNYYPENDFLKVIRKKTEDSKTALIFDEITSGWRMNLGGAHLSLGVDPDIAIFAKGMSNGFPMAAIIGRRAFMDAAQDTFISSTYWTERIGPVAALATISKMREKKIAEYVSNVGKKVQEGWTALAQKHGLKVKVSGIYPLSHFSFEYENSLMLKTLFTQIMLDKGFLAATSFYPSYSHKDNHVTSYLQAVDETFSDISGAINKGNVEECLKAPVCQKGFRRLT